MTDSGTSLFPLGPDQTPYRKLSGDHVALARFEGEEILKVAPEGLRMLAEEARAVNAHLAL